MHDYRKIQRPDRSEYPPYSQYYFDLIETDDDILRELHDNFYQLRELIYSIPPEKLLYRYAEGKWTIKEILVHNIDDERIYTYRALRYARQDNTPLPGFDEKTFTRYSVANERSLDSIFEEYELVRRSTIAMFQYLPEESLMCRGFTVESDGTIGCERTVRAMIYHIAGHELSHMKVIRERYLD